MDRPFEIEHSGSFIVVRFVESALIPASLLATTVALRLGTAGVKERAAGSNRYEYAPDRAGDRRLVAQVDIAEAESGCNVTIVEKLHVPDTQWRRLAPAEVGAIASASRTALREWLQVITTNAIELERVGGVTATASIDITLAGGLPEMAGRLRDALHVGPRGLPDLIVKVEDHEYGAIVVECDLAARGGSVTALTLVTRYEIPLSNPAVFRQPAIEKSLIAAIAGRAAKLRTQIGADFPKLSF